MRTFTRGPRRGAGERRVNDELFTRDSSLMHAGRFSRDVESIEEEARDARALDRPKRRARSTEPGVGRARRDGANAGDGPTRVERPVRRLPSITHPSSARDPPEKALFGMGPRVPPVPHTRVCANRPPVPPTRAPSAPTRRANARRRHPHLLPARSRRASLARSTSARGRRIGRLRTRRARTPRPPPAPSSDPRRRPPRNKPSARFAREPPETPPPRARWRRRRRRRRPLRRRSPRPPASRARPRAARDGVVALRASPSRPLLPRVVRVRARSARRAMSRATTNPAPGPHEDRDPRDPVANPPRPPPRPSPPRARTPAGGRATTRCAPRRAPPPPPTTTRARRPSSPRSAPPR